ncbi:MAG TPA: DUF3619 family protein [Aquabacterium sp.]|uniref:DUF3619 family protein n=1 Tax=Aquabacterium sp. TaxID=1872578 RepID=UPI002E364BFB|nr:DUF3619 family protein [Aquabacterium sp.]HEX5356404.1 DUF3619 family protein [Aquabacterium sp.]
MKTRPTTPLTPAQREALEARFALRLSARLEEGAQSVPHDISERLRIAREQAIRAGREARAAALAPAVAPAPVVQVSVAGLSTAGAGGAGQNSNWNESRYARASDHGRRLDDSPPSWGWRLASLLPVIALVAGLWGIHRYYKQEQVQAATDVDMALLTDDLPPAAYSDPGFAEFLKTDTGPTVRPIEEAAPEIGGDLQTTETAPASTTP